MALRQLEGDEPSLARLELLAGSADICDRAFVSSSLALRRSAPDDERERELALYGRIRESARAAHAVLHERIRQGRLDEPALLEQLQAVPHELRDHFLEELLDVAYPPFHSGWQARDVTRHAPSGVTELRFMLQHAQLGPGQVLVDLGCGFGKVVLLTALLSGARAYGIDLDPGLVEHARAAAARLQLDRAQFVVGDIRELPLPEADVYYMFMPFVGSAQVVARLQPVAARRPLQLFSQTLDLERLPWLRATGHVCYWLELYEATPATSRSGTGA